MTVWVEKIINIFVEAFVINVGADVVMDTLSGVCVDIGIVVLSGVNANVSVVTMTDL